MISREPLSLLFTFHTNNRGTNLLTGNLKCLSLAAVAKLSRRAWLLVGEKVLGREVVVARTLAVTLALHWVHLGYF